MRLQKYLAACGVASRRAAEEIILEGRVTVNGITVDKRGVEVDPEKDTVCLDRKNLSFEVKKLFLFNKPKGILSSLKDPHGKSDLRKYVAKTGLRAFPVGRLDRDAFGLMLLTNDGDFADHLMHPKYQVERIYYLRVKGELTERAINKANSGIRLEDGMVKAKLKKLKYSDDNVSFIFDTPEAGYSLVEAKLIEGRKHIVKRLMKELGSPVKELCRYAHGPFKLDKLRPGEILEVKNYLKLVIG